MRCQYRLLVSTLLVLAAACHGDADKVKSPGIGQAFPTVLLPPDASVVSQSGGADAVQLVFRSPHPPAFVSSYYRTQFSQPGWSIVSDLTDSAGVTAMHVDWTATHQPMWVRMVPEAGETRVELTGAVPGLDTSYTRRSQRARDTTNTLKTR